MPSAYCGECEWQYRVAGTDTGDLSRAMIDHFVETGHSPVERRDAADRLATDERIAPSDEATESIGEPSKRR
ncbi:hypothetical protein [Natrinema salaciae]|uniref:DUF1059 domain-containing protein n=1 Tax=Natrinema salaciae TaxID=1186196 RepID=A0A1H9MI40_9EURY|nr:hypothetical protein [Natrinema salaciae]SER22803.1 hypothetical protein SAMN04489841_3354 [Natrinema salaciae]